MLHAYRALLCFSLAFPSLDLVRKYGGDVALGLYPFVVIVLVLLAERAAQRFAATDSSRWWPLLAVAALAVLTVAFVVVFPIADVQVAGRGSDTDDAYDLAVRAVLDGRYPYADLTYLGNRIHHLPGSLLLAMPFVLLGTSALQNLFWVAVYLVVLMKLLGRVRGTLLLLLQFAASPVLLHQVVTGSDGVMSGVSTLLGMLAFLHAWSSAQTSSIARWGSCLLLALVLSNRLNFALVLIPAALFLWQQYGTALAARVTAVLLGLVAIINVPIYLADPAGFAPLEGMNRISRFESLLPHASLLMIGAAAAVSVVSWWYLRARPTAAALLAMGAGQCLLVAAGLLLSSLADGTLNTRYSGYGCFFMFPFCLLAWRALIADNPHRALRSPAVLL